MFPIDSQAAIKTFNCVNTKFKSVQNANEYFRENDDIAAATVAGWLALPFGRLWLKSWCRTYI